MKRKLFNSIALRIVLAAIPVAGCTTPRSSPNKVCYTINPLRPEWDLLQAYCNDDVRWSSLDVSEASVPCLPAYLENYIQSLTIDERQGIIPYLISNLKDPDRFILAHILLLRLQQLSSTPYDEIEPSDAKNVGHVDKVMASSMDSLLSYWKRRIELVDYRLSMP